MTAEVSRPRGRIAVRTAAITAFGLALALGVASLPLAGLAGQAASNDTGSNAAVAGLTVALAGVVHQALAPAHVSLWVSHHS